MRCAVLLLLAFPVAAAAFADVGCSDAPTAPRERLLIREHGKWGYLDRNFKPAIAATLGYAGEFAGRFAWTSSRVEDPPRLIDASGNVVFDARLKSNEAAYRNQLFSPRVLGPSEGLVLLQVYGLRQDTPQYSRYGYKTLNGEWQIDPDFDEASLFSEGVASVEISDPNNVLTTRAGYIRPDGTFAIRPMFAKARSFSEGLATVTTVGGGTGVIEHAGKIVFSGTFEDIGPFSQALAYAKRGSADYVFLRRDGALLPTPKLSFAKPFSGDFAAVQIGGKDTLDRFEPYNLEGGHWGYLNKDGALAIPPKFDWACSFSEGFAAVKIRVDNDPHHTSSDGKWGYVDASGIIAIAPRFNRADPFVDGIAGVSLDDKEAYIDRSGRILWIEVAR